MISTVRMDRTMQHVVDKFVPWLKEGVNKLNLEARIKIC